MLVYQRVPFPIGKSSRVGLKRSSLYIKLPAASPESDVSADGISIWLVYFPIKNGGSFHSFLYVYQRVSTILRWEYPLCHIYGIWYSHINDGIYGIDGIDWIFPYIIYLVVDDCGLMDGIYGIDGI